MPRLTGSSIPSAYTNEQEQDTNWMYTGSLRERYIKFRLKMREEERKDTITLADGNKVNKADWNDGKKMAYSKFQKNLDDMHGAFLFFCTVGLFGALLL